MPAIPYLLHRRQPKSSLRHVFELTSLTISFTLISIIAVFTSLGYRINWQAHTIDRAGGVAVSIRNGVAAYVQLDGKIVGTTPLRVPHVLSGRHSILVTAEGYQPFSTNFTVKAETVTAYRDIFLVLAIPKIVDVQASWLPIVPSLSSPHLEIRSGNELWQDDIFLTRTSGDILQTRFSPDSHQIVYQEGTILWLYTPSSQTTVQLLQVTTKSLLLFDLRDNGRILVYQLPDGSSQALSLY